MPKHSLTLQLRVPGAAALAVMIAAAYAPTACAAGVSWPGTREMEGIVRVQSSPVLDGSPMAGWTVFESPLLEQPLLGYGPPVSMGSASDPQVTLDELLAAVGASTVFEQVVHRTVGPLARVYFREMRDGLPVLGGRADLVFNRDGRLMRWSLQSYERWPSRDGHLLDMSAAAHALAARLQPAEWTLVANRSIAAWFPEADSRTVRPVYWVCVAGRSPHEKWEGIVDAVSGEVMLDWSGIQHYDLSGVIQGVYWPMYDFQETQIAPYMYENLLADGNLATTNVAGQFTVQVGDSVTLTTGLQGPYVNVINDDGVNGELLLRLGAPYSPLTWEWTVNDASDAELNLFYHTSFIHQWYKVIDPAFTALDYPMPAVANYGTGYDNAFWDGWGTYYGSGAQYHNFAMFNDVIYHEYTHGVTDGIYPDNMLPYWGEPGAMNEAWSDYIACTINGDPYCAEYIGGGFHTYFRDLTNDLVYPRDWRGEVHDDSRFVSGALWIMRDTLGAALTDSLAHFSRYALSEDFLNYLIAVLETDDDDGDLSNGTPHSTVIYHAFGAHGIGPGEDPHFAISGLRYYADGTDGSTGDGDLFMEGGETAALQFVLANDAVLFPPPATGVQISVQTSDPYVTVENGTHSVDDMPAGSEVSVSGVRLHLQSGAPDHWAVMHIHVSANGGAAVFDSTFEFTFGTPRVLVVKDDPVTDVEKYVTGALRVQDRIYVSRDLNLGQSLSAADLPVPGMVIWLSGDAEGMILTTQDQSLLRDYVEAGNRLVLSGQNIADALPGTAFARDVLQVEIESDSLNSMAVTATEAPLVPEEWFLITGSGGAANQHEQTSFLPTGMTRPIAVYGRAGNGPVAAVEFAAGHGLLFGFGIEAVSGMGGTSTSLQGLLDRLYAWATDVLPAEPTPELPFVPLEASLGPAYPNPFNSTTTIRYAVPNASGGEILVYDVLGRAVTVERLISPVGTWSWSPNAATGIYFAQVRWIGGQSAPIRLMLLK